MRAHLRKALKTAYRSLLGLLPDEWAIQVAYYRAFGRFANLKAPETFNEKINWRKLHQRDPRFTLFSDKLKVKAEIARLIGSEHVIPTLWSGERPEDIPFDALIPPYVVKVNHGSGSNMFVRRAGDLDAGKIRASLAPLLRRPFGHAARSWGYYDIPRRILVERVLDIFGRGLPEDHKFYVYHGRVHFIQLDFDRWEGERRAFYDRAWNKLPVTEGCPDVGRPIAKPAYLGAMIEIAEKIGSLFDFVRVDLYYESRTVLFGETTFYDGAGYSKPDPEIWDLKFGEPWKIPA